MLPGDLRSKSGFRRLGAFKFISFALSVVIYSSAVMWADILSIKGAISWIGWPVGLAALTLAITREVGSRILLGKDGVRFLSNAGAIRLNRLVLLKLPEPTGDAQLDDWLRTFQTGRIALWVAAVVLIGEFGSLYYSRLVSPG